MNNGNGDMRKNGIEGHSITSIHCKFTAKVQKDGTEAMQKMHINAKAMVL
jgi:hypothetical protein